MDVLLDEIDSLEAILMDDVTIIRNEKTNLPEIIETTVFPTVGGDEKYVCVTLQVIPKNGYPDISPDFLLLKPRGLDDNRLREIKEACYNKLSSSIGYPVVFDLIDVIREHLTGSNLPSGQCVICLYGFQEGDEFSKTECYHYLHSYCLARHLTASKKNYTEETDKLPLWQRNMSKPFQAGCPVCREPIKNEFEPIKDSKPPIELEKAPDFQLTSDLKILQEKMLNLFLKQKKLGGIIDLNAEEHNVLALGPESTTEISDRKFDDGIDFASKEYAVSNPTKQNAQASRSNTQPTNGHRRSHKNNHNNTTTVIENSDRNSPEPESNHYSHRRHHNRRHNGHRSRRHHNYFSSQESSQSKGNVQSSCDSRNR